MRAEIRTGELLTEMAERNERQRGRDDQKTGSQAAAVSRFLRQGCFTPETGHWLARPARPKSAPFRAIS